ncbi:hypothetical protein EV363DRAFT_1162066 [Boletus edulis]|uniref:Uncharacterized protein n=1 Tax=Boletus edulis BED1 TaxID=1328754 RepID=A0AAD4BJJ5_BOLED|nr:hypothetical protein EV363DRAFT_1162066 [Boletus edulis]KAF8432772.1 hypothetical protein L210DRAFT_946476 [Boletus edulis BED1]
MSIPPEGSLQHLLNNRDRPNFYELTITIGILAFSVSMLGLDIYFIIRWWNSGRTRPL